MAAKQFKVALGALCGRIYAGYLSKDGYRFLQGKHDVTDDVLKAVADKLVQEDGNSITFTVPTTDGEVILKLSLTVVDANLKS